MKAPKENHKVRLNAIRSCINYEAKLVSVENPSEEPIKRPNLSDIDERRYSSLYKLLRVTA